MGEDFLLEIDLDFVRTSWALRKLKRTGEMRRSDPAALLLCVQLVSSSFISRKSTNNTEGAQKNQLKLSFAKKVRVQYLTLAITAQRKNQHSFEISLSCDFSR